MKNKKTIEEENQVREELSQTQSIPTDHYDAPLPLSEPLTEEQQNEEGIHVDYSFTPEEIRDGLRVFQKKTVYRKNWIYTCIALLLFAVMTVDFIRFPDQKIYLLLSVVSLMVVFFVWYFPLSHNKAVVRAVEQAGYEDHAFQATFTPSGVRMGEGEGAVFYDYREPKLTVWETDALFVLGHEKVRIFVIPKRYLDDEQIAQISRTMQQKLQDRYGYITQ